MGRSMTETTLFTHEESDNSDVSVDCKPISSSTVATEDPEESTPELAPEVSALPSEPAPIVEPVPVLVSPARRTGSILKHNPSDPIPINNKRSSWMQLPQPDMGSIPTPTLSTTTRDDSRRRSVSFVSIEIREFQQCIGDNPSVSYGPPISLDWDYEDMDAVPFEDFENARGPRRKPRQMMLNYYDRINILQHKFGYTEEEIKSAERLANREKRRRGVTRYFLPVSKVEEVAQSVGRKTKRLLGK